MSEDLEALTASLITISGVERNGFASCLETIGWPYPTEFDRRCVPNGRCSKMEARRASSKRRSTVLYEETFCAAQDQISKVVVLSLVLDV